MDFWLSQNMNDLIISESQKTELASTPARLIEMAISKDLDIDKLQKLMDMQKEWETGQAKKAFYEALAKFQSGCPNIIKNQRGHNNKPYADLGEIADTIKEVLAKNGLSYRWEQKEEGAKIGVTCVVTHSLGHSEQTHLSAPSDTSGNKQQLHAIVSTVTYLRRITLTCALGIATADQDTDGNTGPQVETITDQQYSMLVDLMAASETKEPGFAKYLGVNDLKYLPAAKLIKAQNILNNKIIKMKENQSAATN